MRLKQLELQGYKTFAARTEFVFDGGIIAIVGPNGSGKSNIADAVRWVLGEQSFRSLRAKRTEDMIFSGSTQRARLGMASACLTLDNADGWLPIDYSEVAITRRAYRSGENEYWINGQRVRLRDIVELLAPSGLAQRTYMVVGQGLVDAALSLRPEDRRALFEEAAGIAHYQSKRADALARVEETRSNLLRVKDIIQEIAPRVQRLELEAERARRHDLLTDQLEGLLRTWYGYRWWQAQLELRRARDALGRREGLLGRHRAALEDLDRLEGALRAQQTQLREQLGAWHREVAELHRQMEGIQRDLAVWQERARLLARQRDELQTELTELEVQARAGRDQVVAAGEEASQRQAVLTGKEALVAQAQSDLDAHEDHRADLSRQLSQVQVNLLDLAARVGDRRNRLEQIDERLEGRQRDRQEHGAAIADFKTEAQQLAAQKRASADHHARLGTESRQLSEEQHRLGALLAEARHRVDAQRVALSEAQGNVARLQARYELLTRLRAEGEGLRSGVRAVLQAAGRSYRIRSVGHRQDTGDSAEPTDRLTGVVGTVAQLVHVPADYEVAVEAALAAHVQDLVAESWSAVEAAIVYLKRGRYGRATFLPLDRLRPMPLLEAPDDPGVIGMGVSLVDVKPALVPVAEALLGRTLVVQDMSVAQRIFDRLDGRFQIVTLNGEILRSGGSITGGEGQDQVQRQILAREREWRELPCRVSDGQAGVAAVELAMAEAHSAEEKIRRDLDDLASRQAEIERTATQIEAQHHNLERELERVLQQAESRQELINRLDAEAQELSALRLSLQAEMVQVEADRTSAEHQAASLQAETDRLQGSLLYQQLSDARTGVAVARGAWEHSCSALANLRERAVELQARVDSKQQRIASLEAEQVNLAEQISNASSREAVVRGWLASIAKKIEPAEAELTRLDAERENLHADEATLRLQLHEAEGRYGEARLNLGRKQDRLETLRSQIAQDLGLVEMEPLEGLAEQAPLPLDGMVSSLPVAQTLPVGLEDGIGEIRAQLRRLGAVNPNALDEYEEVLERYSFLTAQSSDLEEAASSLQDVISELDRVMHRDFQATFEAVAERFQEIFAQLFGGGSAHLLLTDQEDLSRTGVEVVARPPGKRQQPLALLSGGERSLTAVALLFAILHVSPPPFCVLDEVDAMLDEANVKRFRTALEALAQRMQCIIITHNRGTVEAAQTIYGVSMGDDSVSQVISLRLDGDRISSSDGSWVDKT